MAPKKGSKQSKISTSASAVVAGRPSRKKNTVADSTLQSTESLLVSGDSIPNGNGSQFLPSKKNTQKSTSITSKKSVTNLLLDNENEENYLTNNNDFEEDDGFVFSRKTGGIPNAPSTELPSNVILPKRSTRARRITLDELDNDINLEDNGAETTVQASQPNGRKRTTKDQTKTRKPIKKPKSSHNINSIEHEENLIDEYQGEDFEMMIPNGRTAKPLPTENIRSNSNGTSKAAPKTSKTKAPSKGRKPTKDVPITPEEEEDINDVVVIRETLTPPPKSKHKEVHLSENENEEDEAEVITPPSSSNQATAKPKPKAKRKRKTVTMKRTTRAKKKPDTNKKDVEISQPQRSSIEKLMPAIPDKQPVVRSRRKQQPAEELEDNDESEEDIEILSSSETTGFSFSNVPSNLKKNINSIADEPKTPPRRNPKSKGKTNKKVATKITAKPIEKRKQHTVESRDSGDEYPLTQQETEPIKRNARFSPNIEQPNSHIVLPQQQPQAPPSSESDNNEYLRQHHKPRFQSNNPFANQPVLQTEETHTGSNDDNNPFRRKSHLVKLAQQNSLQQEQQEPSTPEPVEIQTTYSNYDNHNNDLNDNNGYSGGGGGGGNLQEYSQDSVTYTASNNTTTTKIALPISDTPIIRKNQQMRRQGDIAAGSKGGTQQQRRRSSLGSRGKRTSSIGNGFQAVPHSEIDPRYFYKHLDMDMPEPHRMKQLLLWSARRILDNEAEQYNKLKVNPMLSTDERTALRIARLIQEEIVRDLSDGKITTSWWNREKEEEKDGEKGKQIMNKAVNLKPNIQNETNKQNLEAYQQKYKELLLEKEMWQEQLKKAEKISETIKKIREIAQVEAEKQAIEDQDKNDEGGTSVETKLLGTLQKLSSKNLDLTTIYSKYPMLRNIAGSETNSGVGSSSGLNSGSGSRLGSSSGVGGPTIGVSSADLAKSSVIRIQESVDTIRTEVDRFRDFAQRVNSVAMAASAYTRNQMGGISQKLNEEKAEETWIMDPKATARHNQQHDDNKHAGEDTSDSDSITEDEDDEDEDEDEDEKDENENEDRKGKGKNNYKSHEKTTSANVNELREVTKQFMKQSKLAPIVLASLQNKINNGSNQNDDPNKEDDDEEEEENNLLNQFTPRNEPPIRDILRTITRLEHISKSP